MHECHELIVGIKCIYLNAIKILYVSFYHHLIIVKIVMCLLCMFLCVAYLSELIGMFGAKINL